MPCELASPASADCAGDRVANYEAKT